MAERRSPRMAAASSRALPGRRSRHGLLAAAGVAAAFVVIYAGVQLFALALRSQGAAPGADRIPLPPGVEIVGAPSRECASGGCWTSIIVRPPSGRSPADVAQEIGTTPHVVVPGTILDWRSIMVSAEAQEDTVTVRADYWSSPYTP